MNKKFSLEISFSFVTLSDENTNTPISSKEGDPLAAPGLKLSRAVQKDAAITLITSQRYIWR